MLCLCSSCQMNTDPKACLATIRLALVICEHSFRPARFLRQLRQLLKNRRVLLDCRYDQKHYLLSLAQYVLKHLCRLIHLKLRWFLKSQRTGHAGNLHITILGFFLKVLRLIPSHIHNQELENPYNLERISIVSGKFLERYVLRLPYSEEFL